MLSALHIGVVARAPSNAAVVCSCCSVYMPRTEPAQKMYSKPGVVNFVHITHYCLYLSKDTDDVDDVFTRFPVCFKTKVCKKDVAGAHTT